MLFTVLPGDTFKMLSPLIYRTLESLLKMLKIEGNNQRVMPCRFPLLLFQKQAKDEREHSTHSERDSLDNNKGFSLDDSAAATNLDNM